MKSLLACTLMLGAMSAAWADDGVSWQVSPGPNGTKRFDSIKGSYIKETIGNHHWFGTEEEYDRQETIANMEDQGFREFDIKGRKGGAINFVYSWLPIGSIGQVNMGGIESDIYFGVKPDKTRIHPPKPEGTEYVEVGWQQSEKADVRVQIIDKESHKTFSPYYCDNEPDDTRGCYFIVPWESLGHQSDLLFSLGHIKPVVVPNETLAWQYNYVTLHKYKASHKTRPILTAEDAATLGNLHQIDNNILATLPPLQGGMIEIAKPPEGCTDDQQALTMAQYDSIAMGESLELVQCLFGATSHKDVIMHKDTEYYWKMKDGGYAIISASYPEPQLLTAKRIGARSKWTGW